MHVGETDSQPPTLNSSGGAAKNPTPPDIFVQTLIQELSRLEVGAVLTLTGKNPDIRLTFRALSNGTIETSFIEGNSTGLSLSPAPRHDLHQLVLEVMVFVPYELTEATLSVTDAAGHLKFEGKTQPLKAQDQLPVRGGSLSEKVERYLEARFGSVTLCDEWPIPEHYHLHIKRRDVLIYLGGNSQPTIKVETHSLFPQEVTAAVEQILAEYDTESEAKIVRDTNGITVTMTIPATIFVGQNLEQAIGTVLDIAKEIHTKARQTKPRERGPQQ